jgi:hypothetical protein
MNCGLMSANGVSVTASLFILRPDGQRDGNPDGDADSNADRDIADDQADRNADPDPDCRASADATAQRPASSLVRHDVTIGRSAPVLS